MGSSLKLTTIAGIDIFIHWTFTLLIIGVLAYYLIQGATVVAAFIGLALVLAIFACVVLHELGHALSARRFGVPTRDITLYPIGGIARLQRIPERPMQEFWVAIAGPAVNVVIAMVLFVIVVAFNLVPTSMEELMVPRGNFLFQLMLINLILVAFNLLPAFPMDGGRVLRALLATRIDYLRATQIAASIGQGMAILFGLVGLLIFNPFLIFIALFVYLGAQQEAQATMLKAVIQGIPVRQAMITHYRTLAPDDTLDVAVQALLDGFEDNFPVVNHDHVVGVLTRKGLVRALSEHGREARIGDVISANCATVEESAMLDEAFQRMQEVECPMLPVLRNGQLVGVLTLENVGELMMISTALRQAGARSDIRNFLSS